MPLAARFSRRLIFLAIFGLHLTAADDVLDAVDLNADYKEELCPAENHGAKGDGKHLDTLAIQEALDECSTKEHGGVVELAAGRVYVSGHLRLPSKVTLRLLEGSTLQAAIEREAFPATVEDWFLVLAEGSDKVSIEGPGRMQGQAKQWTNVRDGRKVLTGWVDETCQGLYCQPSLIGIRSCSQVTIQDLDIQDSPNMAIQIQNSEAVAVMSTTIVADEDLANPQGIVVDGSKRVFIGQTSVKCGGHCITAVNTGRKPLESLLVDDVTLSSKAAAFQVGPQATAEVKTIVVENARISSSKRGICIQLHDNANMHDIWFTNVSLIAQHMDNPAFGGAEAIFVSVKPDERDSSTGKLSNVWFGNITSQSEAGIVVSGHRGGIIEDVYIKETELELKKSTKFEGGFLDFRPSPDDFVNASSIPAVFLEYISHMELDNFEVVFSTPERKEWGDLMAMTPRTVHSLKISGASMHDSAAHPSGSSSLSKVSQLGEFFKHSIDDWTRALRRKGFISLQAFPELLGRVMRANLQENAAFGVTGRKAASSASPFIILLLVLVLVTLGARYCCVPLIRARGAKSNREA